MYAYVFLILERLLEKLCIVHVRPGRICALHQDRTPGDP